MNNTMYSLEEYEALRKQIVEENENLVGVYLLEEEHNADQTLTEYKKEFLKTCGKDIPYNMPVLEDTRIHESKLYDFCKKLPKGSDLHVHGTALVPMKYLIEFICDHETLLIDPETCILTLEKKDNVYPVRYALEHNIVTHKQLMEHWTILGCSEDEDPWKYFEGIFKYHDALDDDLNILYEYYLMAFRYYLNMNIFHVEIHVQLKADRKKSNDIIETIRKAYYAIKTEDNRLCTRLIGTSLKMFHTLDETKKIIDNAIYASKHIRDEFDPEHIADFVIGIDLVNEEDASRPLKDYAPLLLEIKSQNPEFEYYLHCGESINTRNDNLIDAFLLKAERVGHGTNLYRYPNLLKQYAEKEICLESCLISNQVLNYVQDLRLHPSAEYLKRGVTISLCSDDPIYFENETLVDDFFAAIICWDLGIAELKHLCINSIRYSGLDEYSKRKLQKNWLDAWKAFIELFQ